MKQYIQPGFAVLTAVAIGLASVALGCGHESVASPRAVTPVVSEALAAPTEPVSPQAEPTTSEPPPAKVAANTTSDVAKPESPENDADPPRKAGQRPPADRTPTRPGDAEKITFDDLNLGMPANVLYRPFMLTDRAKELEGTKISILGYIHGAPEAQRGIKEFVLLKNTECKFGKDGQADHLAMVYLKSDTTTEFTTMPIKVEGKLRIEAFHGDDSGITWAVYHLDDAVVK